MKTCNSCGCELVVGDNWYASYVKKFMYVCKSCEYKKSKAYKDKNRDLVRWRMNDWHEAHKEYEKAKSEEYRETHPTINFLGKRPLTNLPPVGEHEVRHHFIYDHADPDKYVVVLTRSAHKWLHLYMKRNGIEVEHINRR